MLGFLVFLWLTFIVVSIAAYKGKWVARDGLAKICVYLGLAVLFVYFWGNNNSVKNPERELFPEAQLVGAVPPKKIIIDKVSKDLGLPGGIRVSASAILPQTVKNEQVRATELAVLKSLKSRYPECELIQITFAHDERLMEGGHYIGTAELRGEVISLMGGIPTEKDNAGHVSGRTGKLWQPTEADIDLAIAFSEEKNLLRKTEYAGLKKGDKIAILRVAKKKNIDQNTVAKSVNNTYDYYSIYYATPL